MNRSRMASAAALLLAVVILLSGCTAQKATPTPVDEAPVAPPTQLSAASAPTPTGPTQEPGGVDVALDLVQRPEGDVVAVVNGQSVTWADYEPTLMRALIGYTEGLGLDWNTEEAQAQLPSIQREALDEVVDRTLIRQLAAEEAIDPTDQEIQDVIEEERQAILDSGQYENWDAFLDVNGLTEELFQRLVADFVLIDKLSEAHAPERVVEQAHVKHILVDDQETGQEVLDRLAAGEDWDALAAEYSNDAGNKDIGGDLGWFPRGAMVPEFDEASFTLPISSTSELVETQFGVHILWIIDREVRPMDDFEWDMAKSQAFDTWFTARREEAEVEYRLDLGQPEDSSNP